MPMPPKLVRKFPAGGEERQKTIPTVMTLSY
jgi:hypothetical protein